MADVTVRRQAGALPEGFRIETDEHKYARQTRTATVVIAWIVAIFTAVSLIGGTILALGVLSAASQVSGN